MLDIDLKLLMNSFKKIGSKISTVFKAIFKTFRARSISTQLILTIILIFASFFVLQIILNSQFFNKYYTEKQFDEVHSELMIYVDEMNSNTTENYYDAMFNFTSNNNAYSVVTSKEFRILESSYTNYSIDVYVASEDTTYSVLIPSNQISFTVGSELSLKLVEYNQLYYAPLSLTKDGIETIYSDVSCSDIECIRVDAEITKVNKPNYLNFLFEDNTLVQTEINNIANDLVSLEDHTYEKGHWYRSTDGPVDALVFVHKLGDWKYIITVVPVENTSDIIGIVSAYNNYVYLTAIVIIFLWSFRLSTMISKPIKNIELVAKEIASLNFNVEATENNNKETTSLSSSINLIARNLKNTLDTLNNKNSELTSLYDDQTKQVSLKKQLVSSISHELKTPLMIMQVTIQGILDGIIDEEDQKVELVNVLEEINKSSIMIQDMLQIYRLDDANTKMDISEFNLSDTVQFFIKDFDNVFKSNNLNLELNIGESIFVEADFKLIKRVISNFITNAIKYTPNNEKISVTLKENDDFVCFELINYGININEIDLQNIWMPFYRVEHTEKRVLGSKGSGIGLYLVSEILKAHEAEYGIENFKNGVKAHFTIKKRVDL